MDETGPYASNSFSLLFYVILGTVGYILYLIGKAVKDQYALIAFYENQGIKVFPGAKRPLIGNLVEHLAYKKVRMTSETVPVKFQWLLQNIRMFEGKTPKSQKEASKSTPPAYSPITLMYVTGILHFFVSDPDIIADSQKEKNLMDKKSFLKKDVFDKRLGDNVQSNPRSLDQTQRRRAFMSMFSGTANFTLMDKIVQKVLNDFIKKYSSDNHAQQQGEPITILKEADLRNEIKRIFEQIVTTFVFGKDISEQKVTIKNINYDGSVNEESHPIFQALELVMNSALIATPQRLIFGQRKATAVLEASLDNWERLYNYVDHLVEQHIHLKKKSGQTNKDRPDCLIDLMLASDVYTSDIKKLSNDIIMAMLGGTDTSRNATLLALCHLTKNPESRERVRSEVTKCLEKHNFSDASKLGHKQIGGLMAGTSSDADFAFLNQVINECLRFSVPLPVTDEFRAAKECTLGGYKFKEGAGFIFYVHGAHQNPEQWPEPQNFWPQRFDPENKLYKTAKGEQRHPMAFIPFSFGERKCIGYHLASQLIPALVLKINDAFTFSFLDPSLNEQNNFPVATTLQNNHPPVMVEVTARKNETGHLAFC